MYLCAYTLILAYVILSKHGRMWFPIAFWTALVWFLPIFSPSDCSPSASRLNLSHHALSHLPLHRFPSRGSSQVTSFLFTFTAFEISPNYTLIFKYLWEEPQMKKHMISFFSGYGFPHLMGKPLQTMERINQVELGFGHQNDCRTSHLLSPHHLPHLYGCCLCCFLMVIHELSFSKEKL